MILLSLLAGLAAAAETLVLEVSAAAMPSGLGLPSEQLWLGAFSTTTGQPRLGRLVRGEGGAHLVVPMIARARILTGGSDPRLRHPASSLARAAVPRTLSVPRLAAPPVVDAEISVRVEAVRFEGRVALQTGQRSSWPGPAAGTELGPYDTEVGHASSTMTEIRHEIGFWLPDDAWGPQSVRVVYTIAPW